MATHTSPQKFQDTNSEEKKEIPIIVGGKNEADSFFKSPQWNLSFHFPWNPDPLASGNNYNIYDEMVDDDQVKAAIAIKKDMVINTGWIIKGDNPEINDFVTKMFEDINVNTGLDNSFDDVLRDILSSYAYGFSLSEPVHEIIEGKVKFKSLLTRPPHSFRFNVNDKGKLESITQETTEGPLTFDPQQFLHHVYQLEFGNPYGKSDLRAAFNAWKAKKFFMRFFAIYVEKYASPPLVGKFPKTYTTGEVTGFHDMLKTLQNAATFAIPDDVMIEFIQSSRDASDIYLKGLDYYNMQIARSILVPDLLGLGGTETKGGSFALGKEQFKLFLSTIQKDRESLERKISMKLVRPLVLTNFGDTPTWFEFKPWAFDDVKEYLQLWVNAVSGKIFEASDEEVNYFRQITGFPEGVVERPAPPPAPIMGGIPNGDAPANDNKGVGGKDKNGQPAGRVGGKVPNGKDVKEGDEEVEDKTVKKEILKMALNRPLDEFEKKVDFVKVEKVFDRADDVIVKRVQRAMRMIYNDLIVQVREKGLLTKFNPERIETLKPRFQKDLKKIFRTHYNDTYTNSFNQAQEELFPEDKKKFASVLLPDEFIELIDVEAFKNVGDYSVDITKKTKNIVMQGIKDDVGAGEVIKILRDDLAASSEVWAETVVRTKTNEFFNEARRQFFENDEHAKQVVTAFEWSSVIDDRTSEICTFLDTKKFAVGELSQRVKPPAHFNCRSVLIPLTKFEDFRLTPKKEFNEKKLVEKGGGLLSPKGAKRRKFLLDKPALINNNVINLFGDTAIIGAPGEGRFIDVFSIDIANMDMDKPVQVGFKDEGDVALKFKTLLPARGGTWQKDFGEHPWRLGENYSLLINISAPVDVEYTIEYIIVDVNGVRIM